MRLPTWLRPDDSTIRLPDQNEDPSDHTVGPFWIPVGTTVTVPLNRAATYRYLWAIYPSGYIGLENSWLRTLMPALLVGGPLGGGLALVVYVTSRLEAA